MEAARSFLFLFCFSCGERLTIIDLFEKACEWWGNIFGASASLRSFTKKQKTGGSMSPASAAVYGAQHDTKCIIYTRFPFGMCVT